MAPTLNCKQNIWSSTGWGGKHMCSRAAVKDGYCKQHHPNTKKARDDARRARWDAESAAMHAKRDADRERDRRADCFDDLVAALKETAACLKLLLSFDKIGQQQRDPTSQLLEQVQKALAKVEGR